MAETVAALAVNDYLAVARLYARLSSVTLDSVIAEAVSRAIDSADETGLSMAAQFAENSAQIREVTDKAHEENRAIDTEGTIVIAEAVKNAKTEQRMGKIVSDLLCVLCDDDCTVGEAFAAIEATRNAIRETRLNVAKHGNDPETEDSYAEGSE